MNNEQLKDILIAKIEQEFNIYKQNLIKNCTKVEIIDKSYEINFKEEIPIDSTKKDFIRFKICLNKKILCIISKKSKVENNKPSGVKIHSYINNDNAEELPSLDDIEDSIKNLKMKKKKEESHYNIFDEPKSDIYSALDDIMDENNEKKHRN